MENRAYTDVIHVKTNVIKRNGQEVSFDISKIINAIGKANKEVESIHQMNEFQIRAVADNIAKKIASYPHAVNVEDIQDMVETGIMEMRGYEVAQKYVRYRYKREISRKSNTTDDGILSLIDLSNEEVKQEIPTRILSSIPPSVTTWPAKCPRISPEDCCCRRK